MKRLAIALIGLASALVLFVPLPALAGTSQWFETDGAKLRLVSMRDPGSGHINAALEIFLEPGWKTYWRSPGASGLPPQIDLSTSVNVASAQIRYPVPLSFGEGEARTAGYKGRTVFPIEIKPGNPAADVVVNARGLIGICEEICIPLQFELSLTDAFPGVTSFEAAHAINFGQSNLPKQPTPAFLVESVLFQETGKRLEITARVPADTKSAQLFLEGPTRWYLEPSTARKIAEGIAHFSINVPAEAEPEDIGDAGLTATLVADGIGVEQTGLSIR